jgi:hypothetical protein
MLNRTLFKSTGVKITGTPLTNYDELVPVLFGLLYWLFKIALSHTLYLLILKADISGYTKILSDDSRFLNQLLNS